MLTLVKQKGLAPLVIIILIALAVGGVLLYQKQFKPTPVLQSSPNPVATPASIGTGETANPDLIGVNWKTYTSGWWSIKYPPNFVSTNGRYGSYIADVDVRGESPIGNNHILIEEFGFQLMPEDKNLSFDQLVDEMIPGTAGMKPGEKILKKTKTSISGKEAIRLDQSGGYAYVFPVTGRLVWLEVRPHDSIFNGVFNRMLETVIIK